MEFNPVEIMDLLISLYYERKLKIEKGEVLKK